jgi:RecG-like helicase
VGTVVTGCPEMKFPNLKKDLRTPAKDGRSVFRDRYAFDISHMDVELRGSGADFMLRPSGGHDLRILEVSRSHTTMHHSL